MKLSRNIIAPVVICDIMAAILSTLATNIDPWQPAWLPFLKLAVGAVWFHFGALNSHMNQKGSGVEQMQSSFSPLWKVRWKTLTFRGRSEERGTFRGMTKKSK